MSELEKVKEWLVSIGFEVIESKSNNGWFCYLVKRLDVNTYSSWHVCQIGLATSSGYDSIGIDAYREYDDNELSATRNMLETMIVDDFEFTKKVLQKLLPLQFFFT